MYITTLKDIDIARTDTNGCHAGGLGCQSEDEIDTYVLMHETHRSRPRESVLVRVFNSRKYSRQFQEPLSSIFDYCDLLLYGKQIVYMLFDEGLSVVNLAFDSDISTPNFINQLQYIQTKTL